MGERLERVARAKLSDRLFVAIASSCANEGQAWRVVDAVLAELAGEIANSERYVWLREHPGHADECLIKLDSDGEWAYFRNDDFDKAIDEARG